MEYIIKQATGKKSTGLQSDDVRVKSPLIEVADTAVGESEFDDSNGIVFIELSTGESHLAIISVNVMLAVGGDALITATKDNASTFNFYVEDNIIKAQNLTGGDLSYRILRISAE